MGLSSLFQSLKAHFVSVKYLRVEDEALISHVIGVITEQVANNYGAIMKITVRRIHSWLRSRGVEAQPSTVGRILAVLHKLGFLKYVGRRGTYKVYFVEKGSWNPTRAYDLVVRKMQS